MITSEASIVDTPVEPALERAVEAIYRDTGRQIREQRFPTATYRLQFNPHFTFRDAADLVPYLHKLGVTHVYASPLLQSRPGSMHGYDVVNHGHHNPELGSIADFDRYIAALHEHGLEQILDVVPNHMSVMSEANLWWLDVLENGPSSPFAAYFDIDWMPLKPDLANKVLLPVLGDQFGNRPADLAGDHRADAGPLPRRFLGAARTAAP